MYLRLSFMEKSVGYASSGEGGMGAECLHNMMGEGCGDSKEFAFCERFTLASPQN